MSSASDWSRSRSRRVAVASCLTGISARGASVTGPSPPRSSRRQAGGTRVLKHVQLHGDLPCCADTGSFAGGRQHSSCCSCPCFLAMLSCNWHQARILHARDLNVGLVRMNFRPCWRALLCRTLRCSLGLRRALHRRSVHLIDNAGADPAGRGLHRFRFGRISEMTVRDPFGTPEVGLKVRLINTTCRTPSCSGKRGHLLPSGMPSEQRVSPLPL